MRTTSHGSFPASRLRRVPCIAFRDDAETSLGGPVPAKTPALCINRRVEPFQFNNARSFARYEDSLVRAIVRLKFEEIDPLADRLPTGLREPPGARRTSCKRI